jgi:hypothetical protein
MKKTSEYILYAVLIFIIIGMYGCKKAATPTSTEEAQKCYEPYIQDGKECCLDTNKNQLCDEDEGVPESERTPHDKDEGRIIGTITDKYGQTFNMYPDDKYDYSSSDYLFKQYNRSIKIPGKQCHFYSDRQHIILQETQPWWRPLPIPCETDEDCVTFVKKNDPHLKLLLLDESDIGCMEYREYK